MNLVTWLSYVVISIVFIKAEVSFAVSEKIYLIDVHVSDAFCISTFATAGRMMWIKDVDCLVPLAAVVSQINELIESSKEKKLSTETGGLHGPRAAPSELIAALDLFGKRLAVLEKNHPIKESLIEFVASHQLNQKNEVIFSGSDRQRFLELLEKQLKRKNVESKTDKKEPFRKAMLLQNDVRNPVGTFFLSYPFSKAKSGSFPDRYHLEISKSFLRSN